MNRVRVLLLGLLALFVSSDCYASYIYFRTDVNSNSGSAFVYNQTPHYNGATWDLGEQVYQTGYYVTVVYAATCDNTTGYFLNSNTGNIRISNSSLVGGIQLLPSDLAAYFAENGCPAEPVCDTADDDGDGVCNSCDSSPGLPDKNPCIWYSATNREGYLIFRQIDYSGNCDGSQLGQYEKAGSENETKYFTFTARGNESEIAPASCNGAASDGSCQCGYPNSLGSPTYGLNETSAFPANQNQLNELKNENPDDYDDCPNIKSRCDSACSSRGGVVTNSCTESNGTVYMNCQCKSDTPLTVASPSETSSNTDSSKTDTDGDGVPDSGDVDQTGGSDTNSDGTSDIYAAVKGALDASGIVGKIDGTNKLLNSLGNGIGSLTGSVNGLSSKADDINNSVQGLGSKIEGVENKLDDINDKLGQGFEATGDAALPSNNDYDSDVENIDEDNLGEAIGNFISGGLPLVSYFHGTYIDIGSSSPSLSTEIYGRTVSIDFTGLEDILNNMGLVLVAIATVLAFMIIVHKG